MRRRLLLLILLLLAAYGSYAQEFSRHSIKTGIGLGFSDGYSETGGGSMLFFGYQQSFWNKRLRISPGIGLGMFSSKFVQDAGDQHFNHLSVSLHAYLDVIRYRSLSLFIGAGALGLNSRGLLTPGADAVSRSSRYFSEYYYGASFGGGIRINPSRSPVAIELSPLNVEMGSKYFVRGFMRLGVDVKLR